MSKNDDFLLSLINCLLELQPSLTEEMGIVLEKQMRDIFGGERGYIAKKVGIRETLEKQFDGRNARRVALAAGVHRTTVWRAIRRARSSK